MKNLKQVFFNKLKEQKFVNEKYREEIDNELNDHFDPTDVYLVSLK